MLFHQLFLYQALHQDIKLGIEQRAPKIPENEPPKYTTKYFFPVGEDEHSYLENVTYLQIEAKKVNPDEFKIKSLMNKTFATRRDKIIKKNKHVAIIIKAFPCLGSSFGVSSEW